LLVWLRWLETRCADGGDREPLTSVACIAGMWVVGRFTESAARLLRAAGLLFLELTTTET
jgi:hypothetical protein